MKRKKKIQFKYNYLRASCIKDKNFAVPRDYHEVIVILMVLKIMREEG